MTSCTAVTRFCAIAACSSAMVASTIGTFSLTCTGARARPGTAITNTPNAAVTPMSCRIMPRIVAPPQCQLCSILRGYEPDIPPHPDRRRARAVEPDTRTRLYVALERQGLHRLEGRQPVHVYYRGRSHG